MKKREEEKWKKEFSTRIKNRLVVLDMTQLELSKRTGIPMTSIYYYVNGITVPKSTVIPKLAKGLMVSVSYLIEH